MKKILPIILCIGAIFCGCGRDEAVPQDPEIPEISISEETTESTEEATEAETVASKTSAKVSSKRSTTAVETASSVTAVTNDLKEKNETEAVQDNEVQNEPENEECEEIIEENEPPQTSIKAAEKASGTTVSSVTKKDEIIKTTAIRTEQISSKTTKKAVTKVYQKTTKATEKINPEIKTETAKTTVPKKEEPTAPKEDDRVISDGSETEKDKYDTDPVPEGKPMPVEPQEAEINTEKKLMCTLSIDCLTIFDNMENFDPDKTDILPSDGYILAPCEVEFFEGESVFDVLKRVCMDNKIHMEFSWTPVYNSAYIEGIGNIYEFDCGALSGWMYSVDGWFPNYGCSRYELVDGEVVEWRYTCDLGDDVGGGEAVGEK